MSCPAQERLALHACGDAVDAAVEAHLLGCDKCRTLASAFQADVDLLRIEPAVPQPAMAAVSRAVLARTRLVRARRWAWGIAAVAAAAMFGVWLRPAADHHAPPQAIAEARPNIAPKVLAPQPSAPRPLEVRRTRLAMRAKAAARQPLEPAGAISVVPQSDGAMVVAKRTADPNVVILLIAEDEPKPGDINDK